MQTFFHEFPYRQRITNGHSCMVRVHTKPECQMMTPDTHHSQASVQITTKTPFFYFDVITTFLHRYNDTMIQLTKRLQHSHSHSNSFKGGARLHKHQSQPPCQSTTPASCSYSPLVSSMSHLCVPIDHSVRIWSCYTGDSPLLCISSFHRDCNWTWTLSLLESLRLRCCHSCPNLHFRRF